MKFYSSYLGTHHYKVLPLFSQFLLDRYLDEFVKEQLTLSYAVDLPLLKHLKQYSEEQLLHISKISMIEYLQFLSRNEGKEQIELSLERWKSDQLDLIGKFELVAEDITLINYVRGKAFRKFIPLYTNELETSLQLVDELDSFLTGSTTAASNTYIFLLKDEIAKHETELLEAQSIAHVGSFEWDLVTGQTNNSPEVYNIYGIEHGIGFKGFLDNVHEDDRAGVEQAISKAMQQGEFECEYRYNVNGTLKYIWSRGVVSHGSDGKPTKLMGTVQDITVLKKAEHELLEKTLALERSNANLEQFAYAASHDLKEPIRKINYFTDRLKDSLQSKLSEDEHKMFDRMEKAAERMRLLVDDLLEYAHVSAQPVEGESIDLNRKLSNVLDDLEVLIGEKGAVVRVDPLPVVKGHRRQLQQLFQNLVGNALKYSKPGVPPQIHVFSEIIEGREIGLELSQKELDQKFYRIRVQDNGIGFEQESAEKIFQVFQRLHGKGEFTGTGVGLSIARKVAENHKGYIRADSTPGLGSTFHVYLPVDAEGK